MTNLVATNDIQVMVVFPNNFQDTRLAGTSQTIQLSQILLDGDNILQISDQTLKERLTRWFDTTANLGNLIVERPSTGNIVVRAKTVFGNVHHLKTWPEYYEAVIAGEKRFELRVNDRGFMVNDELVLEE